jgi:hypothetical protein
VVFNIYFNFFQIKYLLDTYFVRKKHYTFLFEK